MDYKSAREELKPMLRDYVERITRKSRGSGMYVCPFPDCRSGEGSKHTGAFSVDKRNPTRWKCFSCGRGGDIFDLIGEIEGIPEPLDQLKRAGEIYGIDLNGSDTGNQNQPRNERNTDMNIHTNAYSQEKEDYLEYYRACQGRLKETDYLAKRGISEKVASRFMLGYDPNFTKGTGAKAWEAIIIPTGRHSFVARNTDPDADSTNRYRKTGSAAPLNYKALRDARKPIFITEGELDALSYIEVGGEAIGLGSTSNIHIFINDYLKEIRPARPLLLSLDNDEKGRKATEELAGALDELKIPYYKVDLYGDLKDANEALLADREAFAKAVEQAERIELAEYAKTSAGSHIQEFINGIAESVNTPAQTTGFPLLDESLDGGLYEGLYVIGAVTSLGKTTLALQIADQIAKSGRDVLIFSLEMARSELMSKSISRLTLLDVMSTGGDLRNAKTNRGITAGARYSRYSKEEKEIIERAVRAYSEYADHIYIHEGLGDIGTDFIREMITKHQYYTGSVPVVLVDYIQILAPPNVRATDKQNIDKIVLELKRISRDFKTPVIGISSFNRTNYNNEVAFEAFKESGSLEYGSDVLIGLQFAGAGDKNFNSTDAKQKNPREIELVILKNRNGRTGDKITYNYYPLFNYFKETEPKGRRAVF